MFCPKCATANADDARFCRSCGIDISLVPQVITGQLAARLASAAEDGGETRHGRRRRSRGGDRRPPSIERAVKSLFMGLAFIFIAFAVRAWGPGGSVWWFWMFLPAAAMLSEGVATYFRLAEERKRLAPAAQPVQPAVAAPARTTVLPPHDTGEIIAPPTSVTEGTTRHLGVPAERPRRDA